MINCINEKNVHCHKVNIWLWKLVKCWIILNVAYLHHIELILYYFKVVVSHCGSVIFWGGAICENLKIRTRVIILLACRVQSFAVRYRADWKRLAPFTPHSKTLDHIYIYIWYLPQYTIVNRVRPHLYIAFVCTIKRLILSARTRHP